MTQLLRLLWRLTRRLGTAAVVELLEAIDRDESPREAVRRAKLAVIQESYRP